MDEELKGWFGEVRAHERAGAPDLDALLARRRPRPARGPRVLLAAAALAALALALFPRPTRRPTTTMSIMEWRAPTDVLLRTPGVELTTELPALDESIIQVGR